MKFKKITLIVIFILFLSVFLFGCSNNLTGNSIFTKFFQNKKIVNNSTLANFTNYTAYQNKTNQNFTNIVSTTRIICINITLPNNSTYKNLNLTSLKIINITRLSNYTLLKTICNYSQNISVNLINLTYQNKTSLNLTNRSKK